jgi:hypothetical protein
MPNEQFTLLEATPQTIANLNRLKSISPHLNLGATEMSNGNNSGIIFPQATGSARPTGEFDVRLEYIEEDVDDGEGGTAKQQVPYIHVVDSGVVTADESPYPYAGMVYYGSSSKRINAIFLPVTNSGYIILNFDYITGDYSWEISYSGSLVTNNIYTTYRVVLGEVHVYSGGIIVLDRDPMNDLSYFHHSTVGPITLPLVNQYRGYFRIYYTLSVDSQTGVKTRTIAVTTGRFFINGIMMSPNAPAELPTLPENTGGTYHIYIHYHQELDEDEHIQRTATIKTLPEDYQYRNPTSNDAYYYLGQVQKTSSGLISIEQNSYGTPMLFTITEDC